MQLSLGRLLSVVSVRQRIAAISAVLVIGFLAVALVANAGRRDVQHAQEAQQVYVNLSDRVHALQLSAAALKFAVREWAATRLGHHAEAVTSLRRSLDTQIAAIKGAPGLDLVSDEIRQIETHFADLATQAAQMEKALLALGQSTSGGLSGQVRSAASVLEQGARPLSFADETASQRVWAAVLGLFNQESLARAQLDSSIVASFDVAQARLERAINQFARSQADPKAGPANGATLRDAAHNYVTAFEAWAVVEAMVAVQGERLNNQFDLLVQPLDDLSRKSRVAAEEVAGALIRSEERTFRLILTIMAGALLAGLLFTLVVGRSIVAPLAALEAAMRSLAAGDVGTRVPATERRDEIGTMARALEVFRETAIARQQAQARVESDAEARDRRQAQIERLIDGFRDTVGTVLGTVRARTDQTRGSAQALSQVASVAERQAREVAAASHQISANASHVAAAVEELATGVFEIARQTESTFDKVDAMSKAAATAESSIRTLSEAAEKIGAVVDLINAVANQTNLLSLNATIEAARAGEAGRGFSVVAQEVKELAGQTSRSTGEISQLVARMQEGTRAAVVSIEAMAHLTHDAQAATAAIAAAIQQQQTVSSDISRAVMQTSQGSTELSRNIDGVSTVIRSTSQSAGEALQVSDDLSDDAECLRAAVDAFLAHVKAA
jgi:methyl-accepting chemotaxis protein